MRMMFFPQLKILRLLSAEAAQLFPKGYFDFVYIDADHSLAREDILLWYPLVKKGGILAGHDYGSRRHTKVKLDVLSCFEAVKEHEALTWSVRCGDNRYKFLEGD